MFVAALLILGLALAVLLTTRDDVPRAVARPRPVPSPILEALSSPNEAEALAALDSAVTTGHRIPRLVLYHPNPRVVQRARTVLSAN